MSDVPSDLLDRHLTELLDFAITPEVLVQAGVRSIERPEDLPHGVDDWWKHKLPAKLYPWAMNGHSTWQLAPDDRTDGPKYIFPEGSEPPLNCYRDIGEGPILLVEGTKQHLAVASHASSEYAIYGMFGCWGWSGRDLSFAKGRPITVILDADMATNRDVWNAARGLLDALEIVGAETIKFVSIPGAGKTGVDDFLASVSEEIRGDALSNLLAKAQSKLPRAPAKKSGTGAGSSWFTDDGSLRAITVAKALQEQYPIALTPEQRIAVYRNGVYRINQGVFIGVLVQMLKDDFRPQHRNTIEETMVGVLTMAGWLLPDRMDQPLMNCLNGMVDLRTGELSEHDPDYMSTIQFPIVYDPTATCPTFDAWAANIVGDQIDDLEEAASKMLDPSMTPTKALLLYGPSRSGKSTYLRILEKIAGIDNVAAVTLHELSDDKFAAAQLYGKVLNTAADLSARHVEDISRFKMMTGEDRIRGNRKYGKDFFFVNQALFAFSTNTIPTVGEASRAYSERIRPFRFGNSFAGAEDHTIEIRMTQELPGILNRLVRAWQRRAERGHDLVTNLDVRKEFELSSDRVQMWLEEEMQIITAVDGKRVDEGANLGAEFCTTPTRLTELFNAWADENHMAGLGRKGLIQRLESRDGIVKVRQGKDRKRALNVVKRDDTDDDTGPGSFAPGPDPETARPQTPSSDPVLDQGPGSSGSFNNTLSIRRAHPPRGNVDHDNNGQKEQGSSVPISAPDGKDVLETALTARDEAESAVSPAETDPGSFVGDEVILFPETARDGREV